MYETIRYEVEDYVAWIVLNRPERRNALSRRMWRELMQAIKEAEADEAIRVAVITGEGPSFCAGLDIKEMAEAGFTELGEFLSVELDPVEVISRFPKPLVAAVNGHALAGGFELTLLCDFTIASDRAQFGFVENRRGLLSGLAMLKAHEYSTRSLKELVLTGKVVDAQEAQRLGFVNRVVPHEKLREAVKELCEELRQAAPLSQKLTKEILRRGGVRSVGELWEPFYELFHSEDVVEGFQAWLERREPRWKGR